MVVTLTTEAKNWLATNAGIDNCFSHTGVSYTDAQGVSHTSSTGEVVNAFFTAHLVGADTANIIANTNYTQLKVINGGTDLGLDDVNFAYHNDGTTSGISAYCYFSPADIVATVITPADTTCVAICNTTVDITWTNNGGSTGNFIPKMTLNGIEVSALSESLGGGMSVTKTFIANGLSTGIHTVCAIPNTFPCTTITVNGNVHLTSDPTGASVYIDNAESPSGVTPLTVPNLSLGSHGYRLTYVGCDNEPTGNFTIVTGVTTVNVPIISFKGSARFTSAPAGAEIWIDGIDKGVVTPGDVADLTAGNHTLTLKLSGYVNFTESFIVTPCQRVDVDIPSLNPSVAEAGFGPIIIGGLVVGALLMGQGKGLGVGRNGKIDSFTIKQGIRESPTRESPTQMSKTKSAQVSRSNISNN